MRAKLNISMPESMLKFVESRGRGRYNSISEYIRELIRNDQNALRREAQGRETVERPVEFSVDRPRLPKAPFLDGRLDRRRPTR
ncbi:MAG: hypothetical protein KBD94_12660 [Pyrinomonadaceae bacterium]|nr:hypothetical protein [Pyrinomonadaceae bacterium]